MVNLALVIFFCTLLNQIVSWVGKSVLQEIAFTAYSWVFLSSTAAKQRKLRKQVLEDKAELGRTSSQDEFAKWAKLRRKLDKGLADLEKTNNTLSSSRSSFSKKFSTLLWLMTTGAQFLLSWWFRKQPIFWLPEGWVPYPVAWLLSFPSAPIGSVSSGAWGAICRRVLSTLQEIIRSLLAPSPAATGPVPAGPSSAKNGQPEAKIEVLALEHEKLD
ncbi:protein GET1 [Cryptococcus neoformans C23]|uniref:Protein GET1 n=2 Tax=Cryptococcus neoformans TaxID=5207 RepID=A0A854Q7U9_CRYNE|nr:protein GET1 [Cryptococcus neoformans var. grubii H99]AUB26658.1 protein GET1 [Cryptococcus neoformans var. grubii]OWZ29800.1 protein GET1 [Cryptococcus neoformans var. grubii AD2-60a]OWZ41674.1 protein GET1 [Cryptococcus neoformans var. grubii C23]OXC83169.1 protein GET1 [Cryptococcus neoformans var. grubii AD1-7a]OXG16678.1 protein GET1 [Cryptococcus neoformans var. grubii Tu259-1]OXG35996.1 protein GET1 [Cryptococcus neoformans var. grubii Bt15]OXG38484.1 protein GET1 [Cryptococcus neo|eukprot:XP_012051288.1 protein GET1 [Cryptococcus neoformans var. grubii H99]